MSAPLNVLIIDDEPPIRKLLRMGLATQGYQVTDAPNAKAALELMDTKPDLIILDLGLPDMQGLDLLRALRAKNESVPIVVLSSRADEGAKVHALDLGADDYVTKPFGINELLARIRAALRHQLQSHGERPIFRVGDLSVDLVRRIVKVGDREVKLSPKEYDLLRLFVQHAGKVLTHNLLLRELWGPSADSQYVRVYVRQLRQKSRRIRKALNTFSPKQASAIACAFPTNYRASLNANQHQQLSLAQRRVPRCRRAGQNLSAERSRAACGAVRRIEQRRHCH